MLELHLVPLYFSANDNVLHLLRSAISITVVFIAIDTQLPILGNGSYNLTHSEQVFYHQICAVTQ